MKSRPAHPPLPVIGWREWTALPQIGVPHIKAKIDTGARTSSVHAFNAEIYVERGVEKVRFVLHPIQRNHEISVPMDSEVVEYRHVKSSSGHVTRRPVIVTTISLHGQEWPIELTLANRDAMGFRMLLGREAIRHRFVVDPGLSYCDSSHLRRTKRRRKRGQDSAS